MHFNDLTINKQDIFKNRWSWSHHLRMIRNKKNHPQGFATKEDNPEKETDQIIVLNVLIRIKYQCNRILWNISDIWKMRIQIFFKCLRYKERVFLSGIFLLEQNKSLYLSRTSSNRINFALQYNNLLLYHSIIVAIFPTTLVHEQVY